MTESLDVDAVAAFVLIAELKSFTRAAAVLGTTQAAVSLKIKRLEDRVGHRLLERTPRLVKLSADGAAFLEAAQHFVDAHKRALDAFGLERRSLRLGVSDHLAGGDLPRILKMLAGVDPALAIDLDVAPSRGLNDAFDQGRIDAAIVLRHDADRRDGVRLGAEPFLWVASHDFAATAPLRLATHTETCGVRALALRALSHAGIAWTEAFTGGGIGTVGAAVSAGLAVAVMARRTVPIGCIDVGSRLGLPSLPSLDIVMHSNTTDKRARQALRALGSAFGGDQAM